ncbi:MAG: signal peptide peptidase SppA, partial [Pseudomonadales bacterium]
MSELSRSRWRRFSDGIARLRQLLGNLFFFFVLSLIALSITLGPSGPEVPERAALLIEPQGLIVEQRSLADPLERILGAGNTGGEMELQSIIEGLERAAEDERIQIVVLRLDQMFGVSPVHAEAIAKAIQGFRSSGKEVVAYGLAWDQQGYLIASAADAVYLHPLGQVLFEGYRVERLYFQSLLEKLAINVHVFRSGDYKEFVEPYIRNDMSPEARVMNARLVDGLWDRLARQISEHRSLTLDRFERYAQFPDQIIGETKGDVARLAMEYRLVDELLTVDQFNARIKEQVGADDTGAFNAIHVEDYIAATEVETSDNEDQPQVAVITAQGPITPSGTLQGMIAADALIELLHAARDDEGVKALVLRIDSGGGSVLGSELIREELELLQLSGKPVVVSMGPVAASGGYWIAATADAIFAEPTTLTGSIGVFGLIPTFENSLERVGVRSDGVASSSIGSMSPVSGISDTARQVIQASIEDIYERFVTLVARGRDLSPEAVAELAQGRVGLGQEAAETGLIDAIGDRASAIARAAELANLKDYGVQEIRPTLSPGQAFLAALT